MPKYQFTREVTATSQVFREADSEEEARATICEGDWDFPSAEEFKWSDHIDPELPAASVYADAGLGVARDAALAALLVLTVLAAHLIGWH